MRISLSWLNSVLPQHVRASWLAKALTMAGIEVESQERIAGDTVLDIAITANRGDCLSVYGIAREIAAIKGKSWTTPVLTPPSMTTIAAPRVHNLASEACPRYSARYIRHLPQQVKTPEYISARLKTIGVALIHPVVDIIHYVMFELGQPMHAFDAKMLQGDIQIRYAAPGETMTLLNGANACLQPDTLLIADAEKPLAIAGVMGNADTSVQPNTTDILLESAFFTPTTIAGRTRHYGITSESAYRFERGVDPQLPLQAIDYATSLILEHIGGQASAITEYADQYTHASPTSILLRQTQIERVLGQRYRASQIVRTLVNIGAQVETTVQKNIWKVIPPSFRFDLTCEVDLIEEIARLMGYDTISAAPLVISPRAPIHSESTLSVDRLRAHLVDSGYTETITYSFIHPETAQQCGVPNPTLSLSNPLSPAFGQLRQSLLPGLLEALSYNVRRQHDRVRLFEIGRCFVDHERALQQPMRIAGLVYGSALPESWANPKRKEDFFDIKGDVERLLNLGRHHNDAYVADQHPTLDPAQSSRIVRETHTIGWLGHISPSVMQALAISGTAYAFELELDVILQGPLPRGILSSRFPHMRRDLALIVDTKIPVSKLLQTATSASGPWLKHIFCFDVYEGTGIPSGQKSIAIGLIFQHPEQTLTDDEVDGCIQQTIAALTLHYQAQLRG